MNMMYYSKQGNLSNLLRRKYIVDYDDVLFILFFVNTNITQPKKRLQTNYCFYNGFHIFALKALERKSIFP